MTPHEALYAKKPTVGNLKQFMAPCMVHIPEETRLPGSKLYHRAEKAFMVGYHGRSGYRLYVPSREVIMARKDISWLLEPKPQQSIVEVSPPEEQIHQLIDSSSEPIAPPMPDKPTQDHES